MNNELHEILMYIKNALENSDFGCDYDNLKKLYADLSNINIDKLTYNELDTLKDTINYFDRTYESLYDLGNLFDLVYCKYKSYIHGKEVKELRRINKNKKLKKEGNSI